MGRYVNDNKVNFGDYGSEILYSTAVRELAGLLGAEKRDDGKYHLSDICKASSINPFSKFKPIRNSKSANITDDDRQNAMYGFGETPRIEPYTAGIPHGVYQYQKPRGSEVNPIEWYRLRDFHGYSHVATSPRLEVSFPDNIIREDANVAYCLVNYSAISGWNAETCLTVKDIVDATTKEYKIGLLMHRGGSLWLLPSNVKVRDLGVTNFPIFVFARNAEILSGYQSTNMYRYILQDLDNATDESYTMAFVATPLGYMEDMMPVNHIEGIPTMKSLELKYDSDRKMVPVISNQVIAGITGYLNTPAWNYTVADDPSGMSGWKVVKPDQYQKLTVRITTSESWRRSTIYINVRIGNNTGYIYHNGRMLSEPYVDVGNEVAIGAGATMDIDILPYWSNPYQYWFQFYQSAGAAQLQFEITAWYNSNMTGESIELQSVYVNFPNK